MERGLLEKRIIANFPRDNGIAVFSAFSSDESTFEIKELEPGIILRKFCQHKKSDFLINLY
jgi:hypothetical protein